MQIELTEEDLDPINYAFIIARVNCDLKMQNAIIRLREKLAKLEEMARAESERREG